MTNHSIAQMIVFFLVTGLAAPFVGRYLAWIYEGKDTAVERGTYRYLGIDPDSEMTWKTYGQTLLISNAVCFTVGFLVLWFQGFLPFNPRHLPSLSAPVAFNTAASFVTNTNWQAYAGEAQLSNLSQMISITFLMFVGAATGFSALMAILRGFVRSSGSTIGNFWKDFFRFLYRAFLPACALMALVLVGQGVPQTLTETRILHPVDGGTQTLILGPVASLESVKNLGTNGGGFYNANAAHPFENPTPLANMLEMFGMLTFTFSLPFLFGRLLKRPRQALAFFAVIWIFFAGGYGLMQYSEEKVAPAVASMGVGSPVSERMTPGNMEGKEIRFGITQSSLFSNTTIAATTGAVDSAMDSLNPIGIGVALFHMFLNEEPGGKGVGFAGFLKEAILAIFLAGLLVGRTPEFLGKKIESREVKLAMISALVTPVLVLGLTSLALLLPAGKAGIDNPGPHGFAEVLYGYSSGNANNGSAMGGLAASSPFYAVSIGIEMLIGRYLPLLPLLALAGSLVRKPIHPRTAGTFETDGILFVVLMLGFMIVVTALTFLPAMTLGPIVEHIFMRTGGSF
jgi:K+-transporting ATPase ATPase A chain